MTTMAFLGRAHYISLYVIIGIGALLLICIFILIWMRKRYSLFLIPLLIVLIWYAFGLGWRLNFFHYVTYINHFVGGSAENYIARKGAVPTDISQLLSDKNLAEEIMKPLWLNKLPELRILCHEKSDEINMEIYWI